MRKMIVDNVVVGVAHIAMSWYWGAWQLWYMMRLVCDQQPSWYHRWSTNHWHTCLWSSLSAVPHDQFVFQFFVVQVFVSISPVVVSSWILHFCLFLNKLYKEVRPSQAFFISVLYSVFCTSASRRKLYEHDKPSNEYFVIVFVCCIWYFVNTSKRSAMRQELWGRLAVWSVACESPAGSSSLRPNPPLMQSLHWEKLIFCI